MNSSSEFNIKPHIPTSHSVYIKEKNNRSDFKSFVRNQEQSCKHNLRTYDESLIKDTIQYGEMKRNLKTFLTGYETIQQQKEKIKSKIKNTKFSTPFLDLVNQYSQKGYKIPNLSRHNNLFKPSIILTDNKTTIDRYFKEIKRSKKNFFNNKEYKYIDKLEECVHVKLREGSRNGFFTNMEHFAHPSSTLSLNTLIIDEQEKVNPLVQIENEKKQRKFIKKENEELQKYNQTILNCIRSYEKEWGDDIGVPFKKKRKIVSTKHVLFKRSLTKEFHNNEINNFNKQQMSVNKYMKNSIVRTNTMKPNMCISNSSEKVSNINNGNMSYNKFIKDNPIKLTKQNKKSSQNGLNTLSTIENERSVTLPSIIYQRSDLRMDSEGSEDPSHFFKVIRFTKRKVLNYNLDNFKTIAVEADRAKNSLNGENVIDRMITLDKKVEKLDKQLVKALEMSKTI